MDLPAPTVEAIRDNGERGYYAVVRVGSETLRVKGVGFLYAMLAGCQAASNGNGS